jgi:hypothetical protein
MKNNNQPPQIQITPQLQKAINETPFIKCIVCGGDEFIQQFKFKPISKLISPIGIDSEATFASFNCRLCGYPRGVPAPEIS